MPSSIILAGVKTIKSYAHLQNYHEELPKDVANIIKHFEIALIRKECGHVVGKKIWKLNNRTLLRTPICMWDFRSIYPIACAEILLFPTQTTSYPVAEDITWYHPKTVRQIEPQKMVERRMVVWQSVSLHIPTEKPFYVKKKRVHKQEIKKNFMNNKPRKGHTIHQPRK